MGPGVRLAFAGTTLNDHQSGPELAIDEGIMNFVTVKNGLIDLKLAVEGRGPLILCVHGFPELWYSWRHQIAYFSKLGYQVAALDVRGYGGSSKPREIAAYSLRNLASDVAATIDQLGDGTAILFGHDWGAPIVWNTALLYPDKVTAVAGLSVPYIPRREVPFIEMAKAMYKDRFFYQLYFQNEGMAEAELEADIPAALRKTYFSISGAAPLNKWLEHKPADAKLLDGMIDPQPFPDWMSEQDLQVYVEAFRAGGLRGPLNRYRAYKNDFEEMAEFAGKPVTQPSYFIGGERDAVRAFVPGIDLYGNPGIACTDFRGSVILPGIGHWVQQEAPAATNAALEGFLKGF
jgi:pimeloyl-ACP methyl ester carboxylesterase